MKNHPAHLLRPHFPVRFMPINNSGSISGRTALHAVFSFLVIQQEVWGGWWCSNAWWRHDRHQRLSLLVDMRKNLVDHLDVVNARNDSHWTLAMSANSDVNVEHPFQSHRPAHLSTTLFTIWRRFCCCWLGLFFFRFTCHRGAVLTVRRKHTMEPRQVMPGFGYQGWQSGNEIQRFEYHMSRSVFIRRLQFVTNLTIRQALHSVGGYRRSCNVAT